jgi:hypothetical protein
MCSPGTHSRGAVLAGIVQAGCVRQAMMALLVLSSQGLRCDSFPVAEC